MTIDFDLYSDFIGGDLNSLYEKCYPSLLSLAIKSLPFFYNYLAEDCVQDTIYTTYKNRQKIGSPAHLKNYLYSCLHANIVNIIRKDTLRGRLKDSFSKLPTEMGAEEAMMIQEGLDMLYDAITSLPEEYQQIFELSFVKGLSQAEIAELLQMSVSGVKKRKARFIELLRAKLSGKGGYAIAAMMAQIAETMLMA